MSKVKRNSNGLPQFSRRTIAVNVLLALLVPGTVYALPVGGKVVSGQAAISGSVANQLLIQQASQKGIYNWQTFSIAPGELVNFVQPNASSVALNHVLGGQASQIFGTLKSNGQVFLVNSAGILFAPGSSVDVGGFVGSTLNIANADFLAGKLVFSNDGNAGSIVNQGSISAGAYAALIAPSISNSGSIVANTAGLAAGDRVTLSFGPDNMLNVSVDAATLNAIISNGGLIRADGGQVTLSARSSNALLDTVINNSGTIEARSISSKNGRILLDGGTAGVVSVSGTLDASGKNAGETGGSIAVLGDKVGLFNGAKLDASGDAGGGTVLAGGNFHGAGPEHDASLTYVDAGASINADAINTGNGGKVAVWSNNGTQYYGNISARGGANSGNGGYVEVSGKNYLDFAGLVNTTAVNGTMGTLLLDPDSITICVHISGGTCDNSGNLSSLSPFQSSNNSPAMVTWQTLEGNLQGGTVVVQTSNGDINIANQYGFNANNVSIGGQNNSAYGTLELNSNGNITAADSLTITGRNEGSQASKRLSITLLAAGQINLNGGSVSATNHNLDTAFTGFYNVTFSNGTASTYGGVISDVSNPTSFTKLGTGTLTLSGANNYTGATTISGGVLSVSGPTAQAGASTGTIAIGANTLDIANSANVGNAVTINGGSITNSAGAGTLSGATTLSATSTLSSAGTGLTISGAIGDGGNNFGLTKTGAGTLTLSGVNTYTGATTINGGALALTGTGSVASSSGVADGGTFDISGTTSGASINTLSGTGGVTLGSNTLTLSNAAGTYSGVMGGSGGLTLTAGTETLSGANTYTGATAINGGVLTVASNTALGSGPVAVASAGTLALTGTAIILNSVTLNGTLDYSGYANPVTFSKLGTATGLTSGWTGMPSKVVGNSSNSSITNLGSTAFNLTGTEAGNVGTIAFSGFTAADTTTVTGASSFDDAAKSSLGMTFANATSVSGTNTAVTGVAGNFDDGLKKSAATGIVYSNAASVAGTGTGIVDVTGSFNDATKASAASGISYSGFGTTSVSGTGTSVTNVTGNFDDTSKVSAASGISYSGFGTTSVSGTGTTVTNVAGNFDIGNKVSAASGISYGGLALGSVTGSGSGTITGSGLTYSLSSTADAGSSNGTAWTGFKNINDAAGTVNFNAGGSITGNVTVQMLDYSSYGSNVTVGLTGASSGMITGIAGSFAGVGTIKGNAARNNTIGGVGQTYNLTAADAGNNGTLSWTSFGNLAATGASIINGSAGSSLSGNLSSGNTVLGGTVSAASVSLGTTVLAASSSMDTSSANGNITFHSTLDGTTPYAQNLNLNAGSGNVAFNGVVGGTVPLGAISIANARDVTSSGVTATSLPVNNTGSANFGGSNSVSGFGLTNSGTGRIDFNNAAPALTVTGISSNGGNVTLNNNGDIDISGAIVTPVQVSLTSTGAISESGAGAVHASKLIINSATGEMLNGSNQLGNFDFANGSNDVQISNSSADLMIAGNNTNGGLGIVQNGMTSFATTASGGNMSINSSGFVSTVGTDTASAPNMSFSLPFGQDIGTHANPFQLGAVSNVTVSSSGNAFFQFNGRQVTFKVAAPPSVSCVTANNGQCINGSQLVEGAISAVQNSILSGLVTDLRKDDEFTSKVKYGFSGDLQEVPIYPHGGDLALKQESNCDMGTQITTQDGHPRISPNAGCN